MVRTSLSKSSQLWKSLDLATWMRLPLPLVPKAYHVLSSAWTMLGSGKSKCIAILGALFCTGAARTIDDSDRHKAAHEKSLGSMVAGLVVVVAVIVVNVKRGSGSKVYRLGRRTTCQAWSLKREEESKAVVLNLTDQSKRDRERRS